MTKTNKPQRVSDSSPADGSLSIPDSFCCGWCQMPIKNRYRHDVTLNGEVKRTVYHCNACGHTTDLSMLKANASIQAEERSDDSLE